VWTGTLRVEGGGFCGARTRRLDLDLASFDGVSLRVRGDGQTFKLNLKTVGTPRVPHVARIRPCFPPYECNRRERTCEMPTQLDWLQ